MTSIALPGEGGGSRYRILGWGASALLHGGALAFFLYGMPHSVSPPAAPEIIPLEMAAIPVAPHTESADSAPAMEKAEAVAPQATSIPPAPPPLAMVVPEAATTAAPPPPAPVTAAPPLEAVTPPPVEMAPPTETLQAVEPEAQRPPEPDAVPLEAVDIPPPPPAPPPPPVQARPPAPPAPAPPRPAPRREQVHPAPNAAPVETQAQATQAPPATTTAAPPPGAPSASSSSRAATAPPVDYINLVYGAIKRATRYPQRARLRRIEGAAVLLVTMQRNGTVTGWRMARSSGNADLDEAAGEAVERASPLPAPPADFGGDPVIMQLSVAFNLR
jgi:protein TonB